MVNSSLNYYFFNVRFNSELFHSECDNKGILILFRESFFLGSTLVIMHSFEEPNSFFGGMAAPS